MAENISSDEETEDSQKYIPPAILAELTHLDLSGKVSFKNHRVVSVGAYGDTLKGRCTLNSRRNVAVAVKRLRFYLPEDIETVSLSLLGPLYLANNPPGIHEGNLCLVKADP